MEGDRTVVYLPGAFSNGQNKLRKVPQSKMSKAAERERKKRQDRIRKGTSRLKRDYPLLLGGKQKAVTNEVPRFLSEKPKN